ncbi:ribose-phosphate diphosphokinase [Azotosporobacter soli]|uniref:ribose-phosphate diphosphokinase n=1 Tax=Azotosporobacter soli TaxID=3055040 RepID=UPI003D1609ED
MLVDLSKLRIFSGNSNQGLAREIAEHMGTKLGNAFVGHFNNGETQVIIDESVRGKDVYIVQPTSYPVNDNMMELLIMIDAAKRASARTVTAVVPYYAYARQDRKTRGREPISAKLIANLLTTAGASRVVTIDLHAGQIQGFFDIPVDHFTAVPLLGDYIRNKRLDDLIVVSPDLGGVTRARQLADLLHAPIAIIEKRRPMPGVAEVMNLIGSVEGRTAVIVDDIVDTAGSLTEGANSLVKFGAKEVYAACTHAVLSHPAIERLEKSSIKELIVTNSIPLPPEKIHPKIKVVSIAPLIGDAILSIFSEKSVSLLFDGK